MCDGVRTDLFPISVRIVRSLVYGVAASMFSTLGIRSLRVSYRLRGASFRVYSRRGVPPLTSTGEWSLRRHYLLMHAPSGIYPLPVEFWLTFPERGVLTCYEFGMLRSLLLEKVAPKQFHDKEMEGLRTFYPGDMGEDMLERMVFKPWLELWLKHLEWYIKAVSDYSLPLQYPLSPPLVPLSTSRGRRRVHIFRYGLIFKLYDRLRTSPAPFGFFSGGCVEGGIGQTLLALGGKGSSLPLIPISPPLDYIYIYIFHPARINWNLFVPPTCLGAFS